MRPQTFLWITAVLFLTTTSSFSVSAQPLPLIDGVFDEWTSREPLHSDPDDQPSGEIDLGRIWIENDARFLYLSFETGEEISLQDDNGLTLALDTDVESATGTGVAELGAEVLWEFGKRTGRYTGESSTEISHTDIGLVSAPTTTGSRFEIAIDLLAKPDRQKPLFEGDSVRILLLEPGGDRAPDDGLEIVYTIDRSVNPRAHLPDLSQPEGTGFRLLAWNTENGGIFDPARQPAFERVIRALNPDVIAYTEIFGHSVGETLVKTRNMLPDSGPWFGSGTGNSVVLVSRFPILTSSVPDRDIDGMGRVGVFRLDASADLGSDLVVAIGHLKCCSDGDPTRQRQVDALMAALRDLRVDREIPDETPIIITGDLNLVGDQQQLVTLVQGQIVNQTYRPSFDPDWDNSNLRDARPQTTGLPFTFTFFNRNSDFSPGRLDFVIYTDFVLRLENSFSLFTRELPSELAAEFGIRRSDGAVASDHLPLIADFSVARATAVEAGWDEPEFHLSLFPNPSNRQVVAMFSTPSGTGLISIVDPLGRVVARYAVAARPGGEGRAIIDLSQLARGLYLVRLESKSGSLVRALLVTGM